MVRGLGRQRRLRLRAAGAECMVQRSEDRLHIFFDVTSIWVGARAIALSRGETRVEDEVAVCWDRLRRLVDTTPSRTRNRFAGGYLPAAEQHAADVFRSGSYDARSLHVAEDPSAIRSADFWDGFVDLCVRGAVEGSTGKNRLVFVGSDGPATDPSSYRGACEFALERGWSVELVSWGAFVSRDLRALAHNGRVCHVVELDPKFEQLVAVRGLRSCSGQPSGEAR